jgi:hypothetical protein
LRWYILHACTFPLAFGGIVSSNLLIFHRLMDFSKLETDSSSRIPWLALKRVLIVAVMIGTAVGVGGNVAASVFVSSAAAYFDSVVARNASSDAWKTYPVEQMAKGASLAAIFAGFETIILITIVVALAFVGAACARRLRAALALVECQKLSIVNRNNVSLLTHIRDHNGENQRVEQDHLDSSAKFFNQLQRQILGTCAVVFLSFIIRAVHATTFTLAAAFQNSDAPCPQSAYVDRCTSSCYNGYSHLFIYLMYTPQIYFSVALICHPAAMLATLWGMTSGRLIEMIRARGCWVKCSAHQGAGQR